MAKRMLAANLKAAQKVAAMKQALEEIKSPENMRKYGEQAAAMIKLRTRLGDGVSSDGQNKKKLKGLAESTKKARSALLQKGKLSDQTSPGKSNLTRTGQLLDSEAVKSVSKGRVSVGPTGMRDDGKTNAKVAEFVTKAGRPYNHLSRVETKRMNDQVKRDIRASVKNLLTKIK